MWKKIKIKTWAYFNIKYTGAVYESKTNFYVSNQGLTVFEKLASRHASTITSQTGHYFQITINLKYTT
jgi:hypothetical protein